MDDQLVNVSETVFGKTAGGKRVPRWAVVATFVGVGGAEPRCVDYRVRVVGEPSNPEDAFAWVQASHAVLRSMDADATTADEADILGHIPPEGIPRKVFETASQARLLEAARRQVERRPERYDANVAKLLSRPAKRTGRPPTRSLSEKVRILADVEDAYAGDERTLEDVARAHSMSRSALRDLLGWARHDSDPPLFVSYGPGRRGGHLTPAARSLLHSSEEG